MSCSVSRFPSNELRSIIISRATGDTYYRMHVHSPHFFDYSIVPVFVVCTYETIFMGVLSRRLIPA